MVALSTDPRRALLDDQIDAIKQLGQSTRLVFTTAAALPALARRVPAADIAATLSGLKADHDAALDRGEHWLGNTASVLVPHLYAQEFPSAAEGAGYLVWFLGVLVSVAGDDKSWLASFPTAEYEALAAVADREANDAIGRLTAEFASNAGGDRQAAPGDDAAESPAPPRATVNARMLDLWPERPETLEWPAKKWAVRLECSEGTVKCTPAWKSIMRAREVEKAARMERHR